MPRRLQGLRLTLGALWLAGHLEGRGQGSWTPPAFTPVIKIHGFKQSAVHAAPAALE